MNAARVTFCVAMIVCIAGVAMAQTEWVDDPNNPIIGLGEPGEWDAGHREVSAVVFDGSMYHMIFTGDGEEEEDPLSIGHATSTDGVTWTMDPANPVLTPGDDGEWDDIFVAGGAVIYEGGEFHMWYTGSGGDDVWLGVKGGYATSPDGSVWTKHEGNPILDVGPAGSFDEGQAWPTSVIFDGETYRMWYTGTSLPDYIFAIGYAESTDGISWTKHPGPVLEPVPNQSGWDDWDVFDPSVLFDGSIYHMWYSANGIVGQYYLPTGIGYATSADGIEWARYPENPVFSFGEEQPRFARVVSDGSAYRMWYVHWVFEEPSQGISTATSDCCVAMNFQQFIPAAALASGAEGSFYQTDVDLNNAGGQVTDYEFLWLPRGETNTDPVTSEPFSLGAGMSVRYANVLSEVFGLEPNVLGALMVRSSSPDLMAMSRTYNNPQGGDMGTFGQAIPAVAPSDFIGPNEKRRILFASEHEDLRFNVGCQSGSLAGTMVVNLELFDHEGTSLERTMMILQRLSNDQMNRIFQDYAPVNGYVDVWTTVANRSFYCYGSVLDNVTSDPTTVLPQ